MTTTGDGPAQPFELTPGLNVEVLVRVGHSENEDGIVSGGEWVWKKAVVGKNIGHETWEFLIDGLGYWPGVKKQIPYLNGLKGKTWNADEQAYRGGFPIDGIRLPPQPLI